MICDLAASTLIISSRMKLLFLVFSLFATASLSHAALPNIILIVSDDQGWRDIGYRNPAIKTPHLDRLAAEGVKLEQHYVFPTCSPTRCALFTGINPARFGILGPIGGESTQKVPQDIPNLATLLKARGYDTALSGKWHLNLSIAGGPRSYGFDSSYGYLHGQIDPLIHDYKTGKRTWHRNDAFVDEKGHATDLITDEAVRVIEMPREAEKPFFLYLAYSVPHTPLIEEETWTALYPDVTPRTRQLVCASISHMDDGVGRVVAALQKAGQRENTLIIFTSDNGGPDKSDGGDYDGRFKDQKGPHSDNGPLRDWKSSTYEGGVLVPAFVNWPARLKPRSEPATMCATDWLATLAAVTGAEMPKTDGRNMLPTLLGEAAGEPRTLYWRTGRQMAVRDGDWKLIQPKGAAEQLYDLKNDPSEKSDLAAAQPGIVKKLTQMLIEWKSELPGDKK
jgi:arylsulfatase A-like enzyme